MALWAGKIKEGALVKPEAMITEGQLLKVTRLPSEDPARNGVFPCFKVGGKEY
jgi:hypothetical protein